MKHQRPAIMHMDGVDWVEKSAYDAAMAALLEKQRSTASHNRYFAHIIDLYHNLPVAHAHAPYAASPEAFRKHGLIASGYCDTDTLVFETPEQAVKAAPFIAKTARKGYGYATTIAKGPLVICSTPHSQSFKAMGKDAFHKSVADVEGWAEALLGVDS